MKKEIIMYSALIALLILNAINVPFSSIALYIYAPLLGIFYYFSFHHWHSDEKNLVISVFGRIIMANIPIAILFAFMDFPGKNIVFVIVCLTMLIYWLGFRLTRNSFSFGQGQKIWLFVLYSIPGFFYFLH